MTLDDIEGSDGDHQAGSEGGARWPERMWKKHVCVAGGALLRHVQRLRGESTCGVFLFG